MTTGLVNLKTCLATSNNIFLKTILAKSQKVDIVIPNAHIFLCTYSLIKPSCDQREKALNETDMCLSLNPHKNCNC